MTLRTRLTAAFVLVVLVPMLLGAFLLTRLVPGSVAQSQTRGLQATARSTAAVVAGYCARMQALAQAVGRAAASTAPANAFQALAPLVAEGLADGVEVVDRTGRQVARAGPVPAEPQDCAAGKPSAGPSVVAVLPLGTGQGAAGSAVASLSLSQALIKQLTDGERTRVALLGADGTVAVSSQPVPQVAVDLARTRPLTAVRVQGWLAVLVPATPGQPYGVLLAEQRAGTPGVLGRAAAVVLGSLLLGAGIALLLARAITRPLAELVVATGRIAEGDFDSDIDVRSRDEVGLLAAAVDAMSRNLRTSRDELQQGMTRLGETLSGTHDLDRILAVVLDTAMTATHARAAMVLLPRQEGTELALAAQSGLAERGVPTDLVVPYGAGVAGRVAATGEPVVGRAGEGDLRPAPGEPHSGSLAAVPLLSSGQVIGVLCLYDRQVGPDGRDGFEASDLAALRNLASQATVAVGNVLLHEEAQRLAVTDGLTGLWNYRYFTMTVAKEVERAARFGRPLGLLMLDLDHFKQVNDRLGHQRGDEVLVELAERVRAAVRDVDTVARYGGEELVVVLPETSERGAVQAAERIWQAIRESPFGRDGTVPVTVTVSVGVAVFPVDGTTSAMLLGRADEALYEAKRSGRDTWRRAGPH